MLMGAVAWMGQNDDTNVRQPSKWTILFARSRSARIFPLVRDKLSFPDAWLYLFSPLAKNSGKKNKWINKSNQINQRKGAPGLIPRSNLFLSRQLLTGATRQCVHECEPNIWNIIQSNGVAATRREQSWKFRATIWFPLFELNKINENFKKKSRRIGLISKPKIVADS